MFCRVEVLLPQWSSATSSARIVPVEDGVDDFKVDEATRPWTDVKKIKGVRPSKPIDSDKLLREMRGDR